MTNRPLTQKEIDLAPEWATHYWVDDENDVCFESNTHFQWLIGGLPDGKCCQVDGMSDNSQPIPRKPFDIESVEWSDSEVDVVLCDDGDIKMSFTDGVDCITRYLNKDDVVNLNKALGITSEDLK